MTAVTLADLRTVDLFQELDDEQLAEWAAVARERPVEPGAVLAEQGEQPAGLLLLLEGAAQVLVIDGTRAEPAGHNRAPTWIGAVAVLTGEAMPVRMLADGPVRVAVVAPDDFRRLVFAHRAVHQRVLQAVAPVITRMTRLEQHRERLASLGTMAAGLAHELNNPAAAAQRAAAQMADAVAVMSETVGRFVESGLPADRIRDLVAVQQEALARAGACSALDALDAADAEDDLLERLEALGVAEPWNLTDPLTAAGLDRAWVDRVAALAGPATDTALRWIAATLTARGLAAELQESTRRMSSLVGAVKSYAYMDRGDLVDVDLHEGLETTLAVLGHKLRRTRIEVVRDYDRELPRLAVRGSELNQVWTNLLDNAIDALGDAGRITVSTWREGDRAQIAIGDDGPGIPDDAREHVFDDFFTTKDVGLGTGLGLATARRIVVDRHDGSLTVASRPGATTFTVSLPLPAAQPAERVPGS